MGESFLVVAQDLDGDLRLSSIERGGSALDVVELVGEAGLSSSA